MSSCISTKCKPKSTDAADTSHIYHEKQIKELCALHALNNLFQDQDAFTKQTMDSICLRLSPDQLVNPHKSWLGLGNYDVNVIFSALQTKECEGIWFDKRKNVECLNVSQIMGFILNIPSDYKLGGIIRVPLKRKHWIAVREIADIYYNLDSKLERPEVIGNSVELFDFLKQQLNAKDRELILVVDKAVERNELWSRPHISS